MRWGYFLDYDQVVVCGLLYTGECDIGNYIIFDLVNMIL